MNNLKIYTVIFLFPVIAAISQNKPNIKTYRPVACDCSNAIKINIASNTIYGPTVPSSGFGKKQEITQNNKFSFEAEHHSSWYLLSIKTDGILTFEINPLDTTNDYDFMLFKYTDSSFCNALFNKSITAIRSNISRNNNNGVTGLSVESKNEFTPQGLGNAFSKAITVKKGQYYMLVLDNVYPKGKGHMLHFNFNKPVIITGTINNSENLPINAEISLIDNNGTTLLETKSNNKGEYEINTAIKENVNYSLSFIGDSTFVSTAIINTSTLKGGNTFPNIKTVLTKLKKGNKYTLGNYNFYPNSPKILPECYASLDGLYKLMRKNNKMVIQIEGHVNRATPQGTTTSLDLPEDKTLSEERAKTVFDYLAKKGIKENRMTTVGLAATQMLYPNADNERLASKNRRVEIHVITIDGL